MYGLSDQRNGIPRTRVSADLQGWSRYSVRTLRMIEHTFDSAKRTRGLRLSSVGSRAGAAYALAIAFVIAWLAGGALATVLDQRSGGCSNDEDWDGVRLVLGLASIVLAPASVVAAMRSRGARAGLLTWLVLVPVSALVALVAHVTLSAAVYEGLC